jgi:hypothetical protein
MSLGTAVSELDRTETTWAIDAQEVCGQRLRLAIALADTHKHRQASPDAGETGSLADLLQETGKGYPAIGTLEALSLGRLLRQPFQVLVMPGLDFAMTETLPKAGQISQREEARKRIWRLLKEAGDNLQGQGKALLELVAEEHRDLPAFLADEFERLEGSLDWKSLLVVVAERLKILEERNRAIIRRGLHRAAEDFLRTGDDYWSTIIWSAIRRYASMLPPDEAISLDTFLKWDDKAIETRIVSLIAVQTVFFNEPPLYEKYVRGIGDTVFAIASGAFGPEEPVPGDPAALAQECIYALAAIGDQRIRQCASWAIRWRKRWFTEQVLNGLREIAGRWRKHKLSDFQRKAVDRLQESTRLLQDSIR